MSGIDKPWRHSYTTSYFYVASSIYSKAGLMDKLQDGVEIVSGSVEDQDVIYSVRGTYIAVYKVEPLYFQEYTDLLFKTFQHQDLGVLQQYMQDVVPGYAAAEVAHEEWLKQSEQQLWDSMSDEERSNQLVWRSFFEQVEMTR